MKFSQFKKLMPMWAVFFIFNVILMLAQRGYLVAHYISETQRMDYVSDMHALWKMGALFDIKVASILLSLPVLLALVGLIHHRLMNQMVRLQIPVMVFLVMLIAFSVIVDIFYFSTYGNHFDVQIFGLVDDDTTAVLTTIWSDYPVVAIALSVALIGFCAWGVLVITRRLSARFLNKISPLWQQCLIVIVLIALLILGIRTSWGTFPLRQAQAQVSSVLIINKLIPNPLMAFDWARREYQDSNHFHKVSDEEGIRLMTQVSGQVPLKADSGFLKVHAPSNTLIEQNPPNVVIVLMESLGTHLLMQDNPHERDLMGRLRAHWQQDYVFTRFVSEGDGTAETLHRLFVRSPFNNISQSTAKNKHFDLNLFAPYIEAGYQVICITAGNGAWRNLNDFSRHLGVSEFIDEAQLRHRYPEAQSDTWGLPDHYMFRYASERLIQAQKDNQPVLILMLSITNHPPYKLPPPAKRINFTLSDEELERFSLLGNRAQINEIFNTFRYANDELGQFITNAKAIDNTMIVATGDHNLRGIGYPKLEEIVLSHSVPLYFYLPQKYRQNTVFDKNRVGSHKDIMPTLYALSLSDVDYPKTGCNLLSPQIENDVWCGYGYNQSLLVLPGGAYVLSDGQYYPWSDQERLLIKPHSSNIPDRERPIIERGKYLGDLLQWITYRTATTP